MDHFEFFKSFPLLLPETLDPLRAEGYIEVDGACVNIRIDAGLTAGRYCIEAVKSTPEIEQLLKDKSDELNTRFRQCATALSFVRELKYSLEGLAVTPRTRISPFYSQIIRQCDDVVGWDCVEAFDRRAQVMTLKIRDDAGRDHEIYADFGKETFASSIDEEAVPMGAGLSTYIEAVKKKCRQLSEPWALLDDVDASLCVLQPQHPKRSDLWRRIAAGDLLTALFEVSPDRYCPKVVVYGPSSAAGPLNARAKSIRNQWSSERRVRDNLEDILQIRLPEPSTFDQKDVKLDCGICFSFQSNGEAADQLCSNDLCAQPFHRKCLIQWLSTKEDTRQSYNTYFGKCPYCSSNIAVTRS